MDRLEALKRNRGWSLVSIAAALLLGVAGCAHTHASTASTAPEPVSTVQPASAPEPAPQPAAATAAPIPVPTDSIYFDYDQSTLKPDGQDFLASLGHLLAKHSELHVRVEGNCDERGTAQYNIALGQRRAESAKKYLVEMGAGDGQVTTVSYGKERPKASGHDESAWRQNRRDDFVPDRTTVSAEPMAANQ